MIFLIERAVRIRRFAAGGAIAAVWLLALAPLFTAAPAGAQGVNMPAGASIYKQAGCITCHKWHGMGGPGYGGTPINFRKTFLDRDQLIEVIACGRPGTGMPYHMPQAYKSYDCYDGMKLDELDPDDRPGASRNVLNYRQIKTVAEFIIDHFEGRDDTLELADCQIFFGDSRVCHKLEAGGGGGGGGH